VEGKVRGRDAVLLRDGREIAKVLDLPWGETDAAHLERARAVEGRIMLAGGLGPENVRAAIESVGPWAVDASSALESAPGVKDHDRVRAYVAAAR
jgi:phosphoribosylanthranilate isomerase